MILVEGLVSRLRVSHSISASSFVAISGLEGPRACGSFVTIWFEEIPSWAPHGLSVNQKREKMSYSKLLLAALAESRQSNFERVITGEELGLC
jgi:hypothetical protein